MKTVKAPYSQRTCVHYRNTVAVCRANVDPRSVTDTDGRLPCVVIRNITGTVACSKLEFQHDPVTEPGSMTRSLAAIVDGMCPTCGKSMVGEMDFNDVVLAMPCRHVIRAAKGTP